MTNANCGACRFKGPAVVRQSGAQAARATGYFVCLAMPQLGALRVGAGDATALEGAAFEDPAPAGVADRSGHGASLCVTEHFGCNRWQPAAGRGDHSERLAHSTNGGS